MLDPKLFHGIAVVIDDQVRSETENIRTIQEQIETAGCHVIGMTSLPSDLQLENLGGAAFFIVDWNLSGQPFQENDVTVAIPEGLKVRLTSQIVDFLKKLKKVRVAPVFIFTNESIAVVTD